MLACGMLALLGDPAVISTGEKAVYTLRVTNHGPSATRNVVITDTLDRYLQYLSARPDICAVHGRGVSCRVARLDAGKSVTVQLIVRVSENTPDGYRLRNLATVDSDADETITTDNRARAVLIVTNPGSPATIRGKVLSYTGANVVGLGTGGASLMAIGLFVLSLARRMSRLRPPSRSS